MRPWSRTIRGSGRWALAALLPVMLGGCRIVETRLEGQRGAAPPTEVAREESPGEGSPAAPETTPAEGATVPEQPAVPSPEGAAPSVPSPQAGVPAEAPATPGLPAPTAPGQTAPATGAAPAVVAPVDSGKVAAAVRDAAKDTLQEVVAASQRARERAEAEAQVEAQRARAQAYARSAQFHVKYLQVRIDQQDADKADVQLALLQYALAGVRRNLPRHPAVDELAFALGALYDVQQVSADQARVVATAQIHLRRALELLPDPAPPAAAPEKLAPEQSEATPRSEQDMTNEPAKATGDLAPLARQVADIAALFERGQNRSGRDALRDLLLALSDDQLEVQLDLVDAGRRSVAEAVARRAWRAAAWGLSRLSKDLDEVIGQLGEPKATAAAAPTAETTIREGRPEAEGGLVDQAPATAQPTPPAPGATVAPTPGAGSPASAPTPRASGQTQEE